jgi:hypothetical protein
MINQITSTPGVSVAIESGMVLVTGCTTPHDEFETLAFDGDQCGTLIQALLVAQQSVAPELSLLFTVEMLRVTLQTAKSSTTARREHLLDRALLMVAQLVQDVTLADTPHA